MSDVSPTGKPDREIAVMRSVYRRTMNRTLAWTATETEGAYEVGAGGHILLIHPLLDPDYPSQPDFAVDIFEKDGRRLIHSISNVSLRTEADADIVEGVTNYEIFRHVYRVAQREALGVDAALADVLRSLDEGE